MIAPELQSLYTEADRIFAPLLAERGQKFRESELEEQATTADRFLARLDRAFQKSYYTGPVRDFMAKHGIPNVEKLVALRELAEPTITHERLHTILDSFCKQKGISPDELDRALADARYLIPSAVAHAERALAKKELIRSLTHTLTHRWDPTKKVTVEVWTPNGNTVTLNPETDRYELNPPHSDADTEKRENKEGKYLTEDEILDVFEERFIHVLPNHSYNLMIVASMSGMNTERAWKLRNKFLNVCPDLVSSVAAGLAGIDSEPAETIRTKTIQALLSFTAENVDTPFYLQQLIRGCTGVDSPMAWRARNIALDYLKNYGDSDELNYGHLMDSLAFIDTQTAWEMRDLISVKNGGERLAQSIIGCFGERAKRERADWLNNENVNHLVLDSLEGDDSFEAWGLREQTNYLDDEGAIHALTGCIDERAEAIRMQQLRTLAKDSVVMFAGIQTKSAMELRKGLSGDDLILSLNGSPIEALAWRYARDHQKPATAEKDPNAPTWITDEEMVEEIEKNPQRAGNTTENLERLVLLDTPKAKELMQKYLPQGLQISEMSFIGRSDEWIERTREKGFEKNPAKVIEALVGLDDEAAWELRDRAEVNIYKDPGNAFLSLLRQKLAISLGGCQSDRAQRLRERLGSRTNRDDYSNLEAVNGIDNDWAWKIREENKVHSPGMTILSLVGLRSPRANAMRRELEAETEQRTPGFKDENGNIVIGTLAENFIWLQARRREKAEKQESKEETPNVNDPRLDLLNLVHHPTAEAVHAQVEAQKAAQKIPNKEEALTYPHLIRLSRAIKDEAVTFLKSHAAKSDRAPALMAERLFYRMHPELEKKKRISLGGLTSRIGSLFGYSEKPPAPNPENFLEVKTEGRMDGGGESGLNDERAVAEFRDPINGFIATDIYGAHDPSTNTWKIANFPVTTELGEPVRETTGAITPTAKLTRIRLPKPMEANILPDRIKGIQADGSEVTLQADIDHLGLATVENRAGLTRIAYSLEVSEAPAPMLEMSHREYEQFVKQFERSYGKELRASLAALPEDVLAHIHTPAFRELSPKGQVQYIEQLVQTLGHFDVKNGETLNEKDGKSLQDQITLGELRVIELREDGVPNLEGKRFAGVCADFAIITTALLREAGFASGTMAGFEPEGKVAKVRDAHGKAYVVWPSKEGGYRLIPVDGTPSSDDPNFAHVNIPSLGERESQAETVAKEALESAREEFETFMETLESKDPAAIKKLTNGKLERALNVILRYEVNEVHTDVLKEMMDLYWYGGLQKMERVQSDVELRKAMKDYLDTRRVHIAARIAKRSKGAGTDLFDAVREFTRKYKKATGETESSQALATLEHIGELAGAALTEPEQRALTAIITYLRAKSITS